MKNAQPSFSGPPVQPRDVATNKRGKWDLSKKNEQKIKGEGWGRQTCAKSTNENLATHNFAPQFTQWPIVIQLQRRKGKKISDGILKERFREKVKKIVHSFSFKKRNNIFFFWNEDATKKKERTEKKRSLRTSLVRRSAIIFSSASWMGAKMSVKKENNDWFRIF